tara:strand:- start:7682 stop:9268 length:1587 start_codon:yes stop_codon:yes gene_type:complete
MNWKVRDKPILLGQIIGFFIVVFILILKSGGSGIYTSLFWIAHDMVIIAKIIREGFYQLLILITFSSCLGLIYYSKKIENKRLRSYIVLFSSIFINIFVCFFIIYLMLDRSFFLGALITIPFLLGCGLLISSLSQNLFNNKKKNKFMIGINGFYSIVIVFLLLPNFPAMVGILPEPPSIINEEFGNGGEYKINREVLPLNESYFIYENMTEASKEYDWNVYVYTPEPRPENMGFAIFLHGYEGEEEWVYIDTFEMMVSRGIAVVFPQYASNYDVSKYDSNMLEYSQGGSNHPQHEWRYTMAWGGVLLGINHLKNQYMEFDSSNLWVGGHSLGAGTSMYVVSKSIDMGWGNNSLIINLEAPWVHSNYQPFDGNMTKLPDHTIVNVVEYEDDIVVKRCIGVWEFERLRTRDWSVDLELNQTVYLKVYSDKRGFPKLIASHYIQATTVRDVLADFSYYKRIDAQASYLFGMANNKSDVVSNSKKYFIEGSDFLTDLGDWSNGIPVKKIDVYKNPLDIDLYGCKTNQVNDLF